ncbi:hypothetical protein HK102_003758 [Quaeritorhiza haematococci]|nr:hypothetical protein HK102_003758 [Quaeritorhiza haematococci]
MPGGPVSAELAVKPIGSLIGSRLSRSSGLVHKSEMSAAHSQPPCWPPLPPNAATASSWQYIYIEPSESKSVLFKNTSPIPPSALLKLMKGHVAEDMDDRWCHYFDVNTSTVHLCRSWTGFVIFQVKLKPIFVSSGSSEAKEGEGMQEQEHGKTVEKGGSEGEDNAVGAEVEEILVSRDVEKYTSTDDKQDVELVARLLKLPVVYPWWNVSGGSDAGGGAQEHQKKQFLSGIWGGLKKKA